MKLAEYIQKYKLSYTEFAKRYRLHDETVRNWIHGKHKPRLKIAKNIERRTKGEITLEDLGW